MSGPCLSLFMKKRSALSVCRSMLLLNLLLRVVQEIHETMSSLHFIQVRSVFHRLVLHNSTHPIIKNGITTSSAPMVSCQRPTRRVLWGGGGGAARRQAEAGVDGVRRNIRHDLLFKETTGRRKAQNSVCLCECSAL